MANHETLYTHDEHSFLHETKNSSNCIDPSFTATIVEAYAMGSSTVLPEIGSGGEGQRKRINGDETLHSQ